MAKILNASLENVDVFTVLPSPSNTSLVDVRFSAHGSPYYLPEKLNSKSNEHQREIERIVGGKIVMISISECLEESVCGQGSSCNNHLAIKDDPAVVYTNKTSFVGVRAVVESVCQCLEPTDIHDAETCELMGVVFSGDGWAMYPSFEACNYTEIRLEISPQNDNGLVFYVGPPSLYPEPIVQGKSSLTMYINSQII